MEKHSIVIDHFTANQTYINKIAITEINPRNYKTYNHLVFNSEADLCNGISALYSKNDWYILPAVEKRDATRRRTENIVAFLAIVIDIDDVTAHKNGTASDGNSIMALESALKKDWDDDAPQIASIVRTGRGMQLWWLLEPTSVQLTWQRNRCYDELMARIQQILDDYEELSGLQIDNSCRNINQLMRLPVAGSFNTHAQTYVSWQDNPDARSYSMDEMMERLGIEKTCSHEAGLKAKAERKCNGYISKRKARKAKKKQKKSKRTNNYRTYNDRIMQFLKMIVRGSRNQNGRRNSMCFLFYCNAVQLCGVKKAGHELADFNSMFSEPLDEKEIKAIIRSAESYKQGYCVFRKQTAFDFISATEEERELYEKTFFMHDFRGARRRGNRTAKNYEIDSKIVVCIADGMSIRKTAEKLHIGRERVRRLVRSQEGKMRIFRLEKRHYTDKKKKLMEEIIRAGMIPVNTEKKTARGYEGGDVMLNVSAVMVNGICVWADSAGEPFVTLPA